MKKLFKSKKGMVIWLITAAAFIPVIFFAVFVLGIPLTGITIFLVQNGKLLAILLALLIAFNLFKGKK